MQEMFHYLHETVCVALHRSIDLRGLYAVAYQALLANALAGSAAPDAHMIDESTTEDHATAWRVFG